MVSERVSNIFGASGRLDAQAEHFKQMMLNALQPTVDCIKVLGRAFTAWDLYIALTNPHAMEWLLAETPEGSQRQNFATFLQGYRTPVRVGRDGPDEWRLDPRRIQSQIGGAAGRLQPYGTGNLGQIMRVYSSEVDTLDAIDQGLLVYVKLATLERGESAWAFAKLMLSDFKAAVSEINARGEHTRPAIPFVLIGDEFGSWAIDGSEELPEKLRAANIGAMLLFQTAANLTQRGEVFAQRIVGNCETRTFLELGEPESQEYAARIVGQALKEFRTESQSVAQGQSNQFLDVKMFHGVSSSSSRSSSRSERYDYVVRPEEFAAVGMGRAFTMMLSARRVFEVAFPMTEPPRIVPYLKQALRPPQRAGLHLDKMFERGFATGLV
jgi:hypothetical protein